MSIHIAPGADATLAARDRMRDMSLALDERFTEDFVDHDPADGQPSDGSGLAWFWKRFRESFQDYEREDLETIVAEHTVTTISKISGTHTGVWQGWAPTGRRFAVRNVQVIAFRDGRAAERWGSTDEFGIATQLGLVAPPA